MLANTVASLEIGDLPILTADMRATFQYAAMRRALRDLKQLSIAIGSYAWRAQIGTGTTLGYQLVRVNSVGLVIMCVLSLVVGSLFYIPPFFMSRVLSYLERDPEREHTEWGWVWVICLCGSNLLLVLGAFLLRFLWVLRASVILIYSTVTGKNSVLFALYI
jgi:hypothetical protein